MQAISKASKIDFRLFSGFAWPAGLLDFARFNLIYGWNASGKTTLSCLFRLLEKRQNLTGGSAEFVIGGLKCDVTNILGTATLPKVRVFNRDFVSENVLTNQLAPIFYLGAESVEKQKKVEELKAEVSEKKEKQAEAESTLALARTDFESFCQQQAKLVKELLSSSGGNNPYNNYNKADYKAACKSMETAGNAQACLLDQSQRAQLKQQKEETSKAVIEQIVVHIPDLEALTQEAAGLLAETVVSKVLPELAQRAELGAWVRQGLPLHEGPPVETNCAFCGQPLPQARLQELEAHFNDTYTEFAARLRAAIGKLEQLRMSLEELGLPAKAGFYDHLADSYDSAASDARKEAAPIAEYLFQLENRLVSKQGEVFKSRQLEPGLFAPGTSALAAAVDQINNIIQKHNEQTCNFQATLAKARKSLEEAHVAETLAECRAKIQRIESYQSQINGSREVIQTLESEIADIEKEIIEHRRPAEELNEELISYLGRIDLRLEISAAGYLLKRGKVPASNLSEGEKTALAFLYFLKSLQDKDFDLAESVVVIDDPVSSLDANSLFSAFAFMKERTKGAGQLFVMTHNFAFFRQVKNWFNHLPKQGKKDPAQRPARFYMLQSQYNGGKRSAELVPLDELLQQYESEYQYLFKKVYEEAHRQGSASSLEAYYSLPNIARRLLEGFLSFRYPRLCGLLQQQLDEVSFDPAKKARILRFLHTHSHEGQIPAPTHDISVLSETPQILQEVLDLMATEDKRHFDEMEKLVPSAAPVSTPGQTAAAVAP